MKKIKGVYKITNNITGEFYIGSSSNLKHRWSCHKCSSTWLQQPNFKLYNDMAQYGLNNFKFEVIEETDFPKEREQYWIEQLSPTYNSNNAKGLDVKRAKEHQKEYDKEYHKSDKYKEIHHKCNSKYYNRTCVFNGETLKFRALIKRFYKAGIPHATLEAKKYLVNI